MPSETVEKAAAFFLTILGALVLGISVGTGIASATVKSRLACVELAEGGTTACQDILATTGDMTTAAGIGGFVAFIAGIVVLALLAREGDDD